MSVAQNISNDLFQGIYKDVWRQIVPPPLTDAEVDFISEVAALSEQSVLLDVMCGYGRHSIALARKGIKVHALDSLPQYVDEIKEVSAKDNLSIECITMPLQDAAFTTTYDAVICMGNSFSSFPRQAAADILVNLSRHLKPGGTFILNTWMIAEIAYYVFKEKEWYAVGDYKYVLENKFLLDPTRIETLHTVITTDNTVETKKDTDYILSIAEITDLLSAAGLSLKNVFSTPRKKKFTLGDKYAYLVAEKV